MDFWVDAALFALLVWGGQHALFLLCAVGCLVGPRHLGVRADGVALRSTPPARTLAGEPTASEDAVPA